MSHPQDKHWSFIDGAARDFVAAANNASAPVLLALAADKWSKSTAHILDDLAGADVKQLYQTLLGRLKIFESLNAITADAYQRAEEVIKVNVRNATQILSPEQYAAINDYVLSKLAEKSPVILHGQALRNRVGQFTGMLRPAYEKRAAISPPPFWINVLMITPCSSYKYTEWVEIEFTRKD